MDLFVYGHLMFDDVVRQATGHTYASTSAELHGFARFRLKDEPLAGIADFPDRATDGVVYRELAPEAIAALDRCMGERFERVEVTVEAEDGTWIDCETHVLRPEARRYLTAQEWDEFDFRRDHLKAWLKRAAADRAGTG